MFLRKSTLERLPVTMSGVRMGERVLQIGVDDPKISGAISAKVGLSGNAAIVVNDERSAARARDAAAVAGVLVDVQVAPLNALPFADAAFDLVVLNSVSGLLGDLEAATRGALLRECLRILLNG
jgi:ubiquinone/menaquinone biosynthesis C-methylase UbiE